MNSQNDQPRLSIIVPIYNEASHLNEVLQKLMSCSYGIKREWIFVNDGSTDNSIEILRGFNFTEDFQIVALTQNQGKGAAISCALPLVAGDYVMIQDADLEYEPSDIPSLLEPLLKDKADVVYGTRFSQGRKNALVLSYFGNRFLTIFHNLICRTKFTDVETCYKIFKVDVVRYMNLRSKRFGIELELTAYLAKLMVRVVEIPITYNPRTKKQGKKITWKDGMAGIAHIIRFNVFTTDIEAFNSIPKMYAKQSSFIAKSEEKKPLTDKMKN